MELTGTQRVALRVGLLISACTVLLTASFVGFIAALEGRIHGFDNRVQWYLALAAVVFVVTIVLLELNDAGGKTILVAAIVFGVISFVLFFLGFEGIVFTIEHPEQIIPRVLIYFFSAALVATGFGYWALRHWREFTSSGSESL